MVSRHSKAFTLVEIMIVVAIIGIIVAIAVPAFLRARENSRATACQENLVKIEGALITYAVENRIGDGEAVGIDEIVRDNGTGYLRSVPECPINGEYGDTFYVNVTPECAIGENPTAPYARHSILPQS